MVIAAYNNAGINLQIEDLVVYRDNGALLSVVCLLVLLGNVLYPILLRWLVVGLSFCAAEHSSRKIYLRHILLHGRCDYIAIFSSRTTWMLVAMQIFAFNIQCITLRLIDEPDGLLHDVDDARRLCYWRKTLTRSRSRDTTCVGRRRGRRCSCMRTSF